jgi:glycosyltransferase involved in cell wall biosynthesis
VHLHDITPLILTYNEEANISRTLAGLAWATRILVVDSFSTDRTLDILRHDPRVEVLQRPFDHPADQCNFGLEHVTTPWVLSLDADYVCPPQLADELRALPDDPAEAGYRAAFRYCVHGRPLRGSLYPPRTVLYRRARAHYAVDGHTQRVVIDGPVGDLQSKIAHDDRKPLSTWLRAQERYAAAEATKLLATERGSLSLADRLRLTRWAAPLAAPLYCLVLKGGLLDGRAGLLYALQRTYAEIALALQLAERLEAGASGESPLTEAVSSPEPSAQIRTALPIDSTTPA